MATRTCLCVYLILNIESDSGFDMSAGKVILVTGASRGIGLEVARWLAQAGVRVGMLARSVEPLRSVAASIVKAGGDALPVATDITDYDACDAAVQQIAKRFGRVDGLVNNAGIVTPVSPVAAADPRRWRENVETNLLGAFNCVHAALDQLKASRGRVVNVSSGAAVLALENLSAYCSAKAAMNQFTQVLSLEEPELICLAVRPGMVDTDMQADIREEGKSVMTAEQIDFYGGFKKRGELIPPRVPARSIAWLAAAAPPRFSGGFYDADEPEIVAQADTFFGKK
jgi:NAD(P)-dependent dehydrogenase (short-subunit alcohol dehydrogenase family)